MYILNGAGRKKLKNDVFFLLARTIYFLALALPRLIGLPLFGFFGSLGYYFPNHERDNTLRHLRLIYGSAWDEKKIRRTARQVFVNLGKNLFDAIWLPRRSEPVFDRWVTCDGLSMVKKARDAGKGVIMITAHTGCFEMLLNLFGRKGLKSFAVGRAVYDPRIDEMVASARRSGPNMEYLHRSENPRIILRKLREGRVFGVLVDQDTDTDGVFAPFLGRPAFTPSAPVKIAMRYGIPVFVITTARLPDNTHRVFIDGPLDFEAGPDFDDALVRNVSKVNALICRTIERFPDQWVWMHRRWKRSHEPARSRGHDE